MSIISRNWSWALACGLGIQGDKFPWNVDVSQGGAQGSLDWTDNFRVCSNEVVNPKLLVCPRDLPRQVATNWAKMRGDMNVSYLFCKRTAQARTQDIVVGDDNVIGGGGGLDPHWNVALGTSIDAAWDQNMHVYKGTVAMGDGSVNKTKTPDLRELISTLLSSGAVTNVILSKPRGIFQRLPDAPMRTSIIPAILLWRSAAGPAAAGPNAALGLSVFARQRAAAGPAALRYNENCLHHPGPRRCRHDGRLVRCLAHSAWRAGASCGCPRL